MKNLKRNKSSAFIRGVFAVVTLAVLWITMTPADSLASTAANTVIRNTVTVNYNDAAAHVMPQQQATVDITVALVNATPTLTAPADQSTIPGTPAVYNYTITSNANGPDNYALTTNIDSQSAGISGSTAVAAPTPIFLGATTIKTAVTIAAGGTTAISVPTDGTVGGGVNGLIATDTVVINGQVYTIASVDDTTATTVNGTSTITVNGNGTASGLLPVGTPIEERKTFTMTVTPGTVTVAANQTITVTTSAKSGGAAAAATDQTVTTVNVANLSVVKEVSADGNTWVSSGLCAAPAASLFYRITVTNNGSSNATTVLITDPQPIYTTYTAGSAKYAIGAAVNYGAAAALTDAAGGDVYGSYDFGITTALVATYSVATLAPGAANAVQLFYKVTIN